MKGKLFERIGRKAPEPKEPAGKTKVRRQSAAGMRLSQSEPVKVGSPFLLKEKQGTGIVSKKGKQS